MGVCDVGGRWRVGLGLAGALLVLTGVDVRASVEVAVLSPPRTVTPGDLAIHVFSVANRGASPIEVAVRSQVPPGWEQLGLPPRLSLPGGYEEPVFLTVIVPRLAAAGGYAVRLTVTWPGGEAFAETTVQVLAVAGVVLVPPPSGEAQPGESVTYELGVVNRGNVLDRFSVDASSARGWSVRVEPRELSLRPGERGAVRFVLSIPHQAEPGRDLLSVAVQSREGAEARTAWFTTILPPGPEAIVGTILSELAMRVGGRLGYDPISGRKLSLLTLSGDGEVVGGDVDLLLQWTGPWDPAPHRLSRFSFAYDQGSAWVEVGEVGLDLSALLLSLGADGMLVVIGADGGEAALVTGWQGEEGRFALRGVWIGTWGELGLAYRETRGTDHVRAGTVWVTGWVLDGLALRGEGGVALAGHLLDAGLLVGLTAKAGTSLLFRADAYAVGPHLPSAQADRAGISLSGQLSASPAGLRFVARWERDNVLGIAILPTVVRSELTTAIDWAPQRWPLAFSVGTILRRGLVFGPGPDKEWQTRVIELATVAGDSPLVLRLTGRWRWEEDLTAPVGELIQEYSQRFTLTLGRTKATLTLTQATTHAGGGGLLSAGSQASLDLRTPVGIALDFRQSRDGGSVGIELPLAIPPALSVRARLEARWDSVGGVSSLYAVIGFEYSFLWTPPFLPAKGWLEGTVFVDGNGNGRRDGDEEGVAGAVLVADGIKVASGGDGRFLFPPLAPGRYALAVDRLPPEFRPRLELPLQVVVVLAGRTLVGIPCQRVGKIVGAVYDDGNQSGTRDQEEQGLGGALVIIEQDGVRIGEVYTDPGGGFSFPGLPPGEYRVRVEPRSLPERYVLTTPAEVHVPLAPGAAAEVLFGAWLRPRPVVVVYQPPVADFAWTPSAPRAGQPVTFDAGASQGKIIKYSWELTGDEIFDAAGPTVTWTFPTAGFYLVALVVTDSEGLEDELELLVQVGP